MIAFPFNPLSADLGACKKHLIIDIEIGDISTYADRRYE
jgi:hypothetical protein